MSKESVSVMYEIGGSICSDTVSDLDFLLLNYGFEDFSSQSIPQREYVAPALAKKTSLNIAADLQRGAHKDLDIFLINNQLTFRASYIDAEVMFEQGVRYWRPGMEEIDNFELSPGGKLVLHVTNLNRHFSNETGAATILHRIERTAHVPILELSA